MHKYIIGWDVGGAHLKAALLQADGTLLHVLQLPCALWRGLHELEVAINHVIQVWHSSFSADETRHAITMTGELVDLFDSRREGVNAISQLMQTKLAGDKFFYAGATTGSESMVSHFVTVDQVDANWRSIASANWLASAMYIAGQLKDQIKYVQVLLIDIGSTTTDFVAIQNGQPICQSFTDASRMQTEELVYSGVIRTPLMALTQTIAFKDEPTTLAAEYFATMADVYRLTGDLLEADDMAETADGKAKTPLASARRLARMIGRDVEDAALADWVALAQAFKNIQLTRLSKVAQQHISRFETTSDVLVLGAGAGSFLAAEIAAACNFSYQDSTALLENLSATNDSSLVNSKNLAHWAKVCLPAYAVAFLALHNL